MDIRNFIQIKRYLRIIVYSVSQIKKGVKEPKLTVREVREKSLDIHHYIHRKILCKDGIDVMEKDWDNLIILDACRYDMFKEIVEIDGELRMVESSGSGTKEFIQNNFNDKSYADTVYVSANAQIDYLNIGPNFHSTKRLWDDYWDENLSTVPPSSAADGTIEASEKYPNKRIISHFVQPHWPFIGEFGQQINHKGFSRGKMYETDDRQIWHQLRDGDIDKDSVLRAYKENLEIALPAVNRLIEQLEGKTVVTSDHGNSFGTFGVYGHPNHRYLNELVKVPWFIPEYDSRKDIEAGELNIDGQKSRDSVINDRLEALGYR